MSRRSPLSDDDACYAAASWASGTGQRELGRQFGYRTGSQVCWAIGSFIDHYSGERATRRGGELVWGNEGQKSGEARKALVRRSVENYLGLRGDV